MGKRKNVPRDGFAYRIVGEKGYFRLAFVAHKNFKAVRIVPGDLSIVGSDLDSIKREIEEVNKALLRPVVTPEEISGG